MEDAHMNMVLALLPLITLTASGDPIAQRLSGIVIEAETMELQGGWKAVRAGAGNLLVDQLGSSHISGERLALLPADQNGQATIKVRIPHAGAYVVWVRHEHATGCDASFTVQINQAGAEQVAFSIQHLSAFWSAAVQFLNAAVLDQRSARLDGFPGPNEFDVMNEYRLVFFSGFHEWVRSSSEARGEAMMRFTPAFLSDSCMAGEMPESVIRPAACRSSPKRTSAFFPSFELSATT
jgi:hypothetical protein